MASPLQEIVLASSPDCSTIVAYDPSSGTVLARFTGSRSPRKGLAIIENHLIAASHISPDTALGSIHLYNWWSSTPTHNLPVIETVCPITSTFDGNYLFAGGISGHIHALSLPSGDTVQSFSAHRKPVSCLAIHHDGSLLFSGGDDGTIAVFPIHKLVDISSSNSSQSQLVLHRFIGHDSTITSITTGTGYSSCTIVSCSLDSTCKFWSLMHWTHLKTVTFPCPIWGITMDPIESEFFVAGSDGLVYNGALKAATRRDHHLVKQENKLVPWEQKHGGAVIAMGMMNWGQNLVTASEDGRIWIWEVSRKKAIRVLGEEMGSISELVVAKWFGGGGGIGLGPGGGSNESRVCRSRFSGKEMSRPIRKVMDVERDLGVLEQDKSRAIDTLGSAIGTYEKLLELILKEAKMQHSDNGNEEGDGI
ncbi:hypothetical protein U1Q18_000821 [Sarracenia purpurea var. burkii]